VRNTFFHLEAPQKIWGAQLGKSVAGLGFAKSHHQKKIIGLWIKSVNISIASKTQKNRKLDGFQIKFCEDKKLHFCDVVKADVLKRSTEANGQHPPF
jgi:hypothetical protein